MTTRVSLADLTAAGIQLRPAQAVTLVAEVCRQVICGEIPSVPSPGLIRVTRDGQVIAQGPIDCEEPSVARAGQLLHDLLPGLDAPATYRASGALRLVIARALGTLDLPPYSGLDQFRAALARFAGADPAATSSGLFRQWREGRSIPAAKEHDAAPVASRIPPADVNVEDEIEPGTGLIPSGRPAVALVESRNALPHQSAPVSSTLTLVVAVLLALGGIAVVLGSAADRPIWYRADARRDINPQLLVPRVQGAAPVTSPHHVVVPAVMTAAAPARTPATRTIVRPRAPRMASQPHREAAPARRRPAVPEPGRLVDPGPDRQAAPVPRSKAARLASFFKRELFRIEIK